MTPRWRRALIWLGVALGFFIYIDIFGVSVLFVLVWGRTLGDKPDPNLWKVPVALKDLAISTAPGTKLSYFGYEFEAPWNDLDEQRTRRVRAWQLIGFHSGKSIIFYTSGPNEFVNEVFGKNTVDKKSLARLFGDQTVQSGYAFQRAALDATPGQIGLLTPRWRAARTIFLLVLKSVFVGAYSGGSGVLLVQTKDFRGFQYGDPAGHPSAIEVDLFGSKNRLHFVFPDKKDSGGISQAEINRVVQSVRPVQEQAQGGH
jgi:hypothetical protein